MHEVWEQLGGRDKGYQVSTWGRVKGKLGVIIPPAPKSVERGVPCVVVHGELRKVRTLVASVFGPEAGRVAEMVVLGEERILDLQVELEGQLLAIAEALRMARVRPGEAPTPRLRVIEAGEDIAGYLAPGPTTPQQLAAEEAGHLAAVYRAGIAVDPDSRLTRDEVEQRLLHLVRVFGPAVEAEVADLVLPMTSPTTLVLSLA